MAAMSAFAQTPLDKPIPVQQQTPPIQTTEPALTTPSVASAQPVQTAETLPSFYATHSIESPMGPGQNYTTQLQTPGPRVLTPLTAPPPVERNTIERMDGLSSQPWARMAGNRPGWSAFPDQNSAQPMLPFFWVGADPQSNPGPQRGN